MNGLRSHIKNSKECFIRYPNTLKLVKKNSAVPLVFNPLLSVKYPDETLSCLTYYLKSFEPVGHEIGQNAA